LEKPELFSSKKEFLYFSLVLLFLLSIHLSFKFYTYQEFISKPFYYTYAKVTNAYRKTKYNKTYQVLKLRSEEGFSFYTTTHRKESFWHKRLRLQIFPNERIGFSDYLGTFYVKSKIKHQEKIAPKFKDKLLTYIANQHDNSTLQSFYNAIFFATPLARELRKKISMLGVSHLVALSGFHLGILWGLIYGLFLFIYRPLQQRYFPYRHALFDVGLVVMALLGIYVWFVDFPPSLVRSYAMVLVGWMVLLLGIKLLSFTFLTTILLSLVVMFPSLLVSLSFWFSVAGVFYIYLLLQYTQMLSAWVLSLLLIPLGIFILMLPIVHTLFGMTSVYQLLSPLLSVLFILFYPLVMGLHILGIGGVLDTALLWLFSLPQNGVEYLLSPWVVLGYVAVSIGAIWYRKMFYLLVVLAMGYGGYLFF
jgi:competence protein ComEC